MFTDADEAYYQRVVGVIEFQKFIDEELWGNLLTERCPECGQVPTGLDIQLHRMHDGFIIVACEGYWVMDPEKIGLGTGNWMDFRDGINDIEYWKRTGIDEGDGA